MKNKWLFILLVLSLAGNTVFLSSLATRKLFHRTAATPPPSFSIGIPLSISPEQQRQVNDIVKKFKIESLGAKEDILEKRIEIIEELGKPDHDADVVRTKAVELNQLENQLNTNFIDVLLKVSNILDSGQRLHLLYQLSRDWYFLNSQTDKGGAHE